MQINQLIYYFQLTNTFITGRTIILFMFTV